MNKSYEIYFIVKSHLDKARYDEIADIVKSFITNEKGTVHYFNIEGLKKLATPINKATEGHYMLSQFTVSTQSLAEIKRKLSLVEDILRYMIVKLEDVTPKFDTSKVKTS